MKNNQAMTEQAAGLMGQIENLPASAYYWGALGSIGISALLMLFGRKNLSVFVGLWPPTIALLGLFNKQLHPSQDIREAGNISGVDRDDLNGLRDKATQAGREMISSH
jgi:hypothetical protein